MSVLDLIWEPDGLARLEHIVDYIAERSPPAARKLQQSIFDAMERARKFPLMERPGRVAGTRELVIHPNYIVIYNVNSDIITILNVLHARQRYP